eukprot:1193818-Prorocentrum_minimum.AAC.3
MVTLSLATLVMSSSSASIMSTDDDATKMSAPTSHPLTTGSAKVMVVSPTFAVVVSLVQVGLTGLPCRSMVPNRTAIT